MTLLSIYVPTWNRAAHFNNLMDSLNGQITDEVEVVASFNPPNENYRWPSWCRVVRQQSNVGGRVQFLLGPLLTRGEYLWMIGDDDEVTEGGVSAVLEACATGPGIVVNWDGRLDLGAQIGARFDDYREFALEVQRAGRSQTVTALTLCSATAFRREGFHLELALRKTDTMYGQHYGMLSRLWREPVQIVSRPSFTAANASQTASILMQSAEMVTEHMSMYPRCMYDLVGWINAGMGLALRPEDTWIPGGGFDG